MPHTPRRGRPAQLSRDRIVDAALAVGLDTMTMAGLAAHLGVAKASLYRWVSGRAEVLGLVSDVVVERILPPALPADQDWRAWLVELAMRMQREFLAVPGYAARMAAPHEHHSDAHLRLEQTVVAALTAGGLDDRTARLTCRLVLTALAGWLAAEAHWATTTPDVPRFDQFLDVLVRGLPPRA